MWPDIEVGRWWRVCLDIEVDGCGIEVGRQWRVCLDIEVGRQWRVWLERGR